MPGRAPLDDNETVLRNLGETMKMRLVYLVVLALALVASFGGGFFWDSVLGSL
jgi:hypothetical protein